MLGGLQRSSVADRRVGVRVPVRPRVTQGELESTSTGLLHHSSDISVASHGSVDMREWYGRLQHYKTYTWSWICRRVGGVPRYHT